MNLFIFPESFLIPFLCSSLMTYKSVTYKSEDMLLISPIANKKGIWIS